jgi:uroporphyrinogen decarboxylase
MTALNYKEPDRVPMDLVPTIDVYKDLREHLDLYDAPENPPMDYSTIVEMPMEMTRALQLDACWVSPRSGTSIHSKKFSDGSFVTEWGVPYNKAVLPSGIFYFEVGEPPLAKATLEDIKKYAWPDPDDPARYMELETKLPEIRANSDVAILCKLAGPVFELGKLLRGFSQWFMDLMINRELANHLMERICDVQMKINDNCMSVVGEHIDVLRLAGEDLGMQDRTLISPDLFREMVKPHLKRLWLHAKETLHKYNPEAKIMLHTCGSVYDFIPDLIECGVDVLDPVQPRAAKMERFQLKADFGKKISFHGGIDIQDVLPFGTKADIDEEVKLAIKALAPGGGYWLAPAHNVQGDVSAENLLIMLEAARKYGQYPLNIE